jgi:hypothetical protein
MTKQTVKELLGDLKTIFPKEKNRICFLLTGIDEIDTEEFIQSICSEILPHKKKVEERNVDELIAVLKVFVSDIDTDQWGDIDDENKKVVWEYADTLIFLLSAIQKKKKSI